MKNKNAQKAPAVRPYSIDLSEGGRTQQHFTEQCDVNNIVAHYMRTGIDPYESKKALAKFGFASSQDFSEAMRNVAEIQTAFQQLPSAERSTFNNDPTTWLNYLTTSQPEADEKTPPEDSQDLSAIPPADPPADPDTAAD